jgi:hypothetical protein
VVKSISGVTPEQAEYQARVGEVCASYRSLLDSLIPDSGVAPKRSEFTRDSLCVALRLDVSHKRRKFVVVYYFDLSWCTMSGILCLE